MRLNVKRLSATILAGALVFGLGACGDDEDDDDAAAGDTDTEETQPDGGDAAAGGDGIVIAQFEFNEVTAGAGATISVTNEDSAPHTVSSDDDAWEPVSVDGGASDELTAPSEPGEYAYHCDIHPQMTGTLVVE